MKILLSYSYFHFDPGKPVKDQPYRNSSAAVLARTFFEVLSKFGDVTYTDAYRYKEHVGKEFDLFVGISSHFHDILNANGIKVKKSLYIAVNMHPLERNRILRQAVDELALGEEAIGELDLVDPTPAIEALKRADFILSIGNIGTYNSYIKHGVPKSKIKLFNYGHTDQIKPGKTVKGPNRYAYVASEIGLRKGFDVLYEMFSHKALSEGKFHLDIVGKPSTPYHSDKVERLTKLMGQKVTYHGWLDATSTEYSRILDEADFQLFPTLEDAQPGTVTDGLARGVIPILSDNAGIDYAPLGSFAVSGADRVKHNVSLIKQTLAMSKGDIKTLEEKTREYYREYHQNFAPTIFEAIQNALTTDSLYPKVSLVLAIFNKGTTIKSLLENLDAAIGDYPDAELHIIFDGCTDNTERVTRQFYRRPHRYNVTFEVTPNIFEVKTNNLGLKKSTGKYGIIIQDDNYVYDNTFLYDIVNYLDRNPTAVVLGGLAGVNFYPRGTTGLEGSGQIAMTDDEVYWRQDERTDPALKDRVFQVDACMRGPLTLRKSFLDQHGYLDEIYAPLYEDDMDLGMRAASLGYKVYCMILNVENKSLTMAHANPERSKFFANIITRNTGIFYTRWQPSTDKDYSWVNRTHIWQPTADAADAQRRKQEVAGSLARLQRMQDEGKQPLTARGAIKKTINVILKPGGVEVQPIKAGAEKASEPQPIGGIKGKLKAAANSVLKPTGLELKSTKAPASSSKTDEFDPSPYRWLMRMNIKTVLDIGANTGQFATYIHKIIPGAAIVSFEPLKDCYQELLKNCKHISDFTAYDFALGDKVGKVPIHRSEFSPSSSLLPMGELHKEAFPFTKEETIEEIEIRKLDDIKGLPIESPLMVKIDVQGTEDKVIKGGQSVIEKADIVLLEVSFADLYEGQPLFGPLYDQLTKLGFIYSGNWYQDNDTRDGKPLQADAIFLKAPAVERTS